VGDILHTLHQILYCQADNHNDNQIGDIVYDRACYHLYRFENIREQGFGERLRLREQRKQQGNAKHQLNKDKHPFHYLGEEEQDKPLTVSVQKLIIAYTDRFELVSFKTYDRPAKLAEQIICQIK
jgi:hypothetical protein